MLTNTCNNKRCPLLFSLVGHKFSKYFGINIIEMTNRFVGQKKVTNQGIHEHKIFQGVKIFSRSKLSKDQKSILTQKLYLTPKQNIVYYQRTDVNYDQNWHHNKDYYELAYGQLDRETVFKVCQDFDELSPFLENELLERLKEKLVAGKFFEKLDI